MQSVLKVSVMNAGCECELFRVHSEGRNAKRENLCEGVKESV